MTKSPWQHLLPTIPKSELCLEDEAAMVQRREPEVERQMSRGLASLPGESTASSKWTQPKLNSFVKPCPQTCASLRVPISVNITTIYPSCPSPKSGQHTLVLTPCDSPHLINNHPMWWYFPNISKNPSSSLQPYGTTWFRLPLSLTFFFNSFLTVSLTPRLCEPKSIHFTSFRVTFQWYKSDRVPPHPHPSTPFGSSSFLWGSFS